MEWVSSLVIVLACMMAFVLLGLPIAIAFGLANIVNCLIFLGPKFLPLLVFSAYAGVSPFTYIAVPLFILMGELVVQGGMAERLISISEGWLGRFSGGLYHSLIASGAVFGALCGSSMAACAALGRILLPVMRARRYDKKLSSGVLAIGGALSVIIPPSVLVIIMAGIAHVSAGQLLMAGIIPGMLVAVLSSLVVAIRIKLNPSLAGREPVSKVNYGKLLREMSIHALPIMFIIFAVMGLIYLGVATPSEAAATGAVGSFIVAMAYRRLNLKALRSAILGVVQVTGMLLFICSASLAYSQILALTGATTRLVESMLAFQVGPGGLIAVTVVVLLFLGCFLDQVSMMLIVMPLVKPVTEALGLDLIWFCIIFLLAAEMGLLTPPFGLNLFVVKAVSPPDTSMADVIRGAVPFLIPMLVVIVAVAVVPSLATWIPQHMIR